MLLNAFAKSSRSSRIAFSAAIIAITAVAAYNWMVSPHTKYLHAVQQYKLMTSDIARKNQIIKAREAIKKKEIEKLRTELANTQTSLFTPDEAKRFFGSIEACCKEANCMIYSINFLSGNLNVLSVPAASQKRSKTAGVENSKAIAENNAAVSFVGSYSNIISFLAKLVNRPQKVLVRSLKIFASRDEFYPLGCEVMITIYTVRDKEIFTNE